MTGRFTVTSEHPDAIGWNIYGYSTLVEVKVSRGDFFRDFKKPWRVSPDLGMGSKRYYMMPRGLVRVDELPKGWGLIEVAGGRAVVSVPSDGFGKDTWSELRLVLAHHRRATAPEKR